MQGVHDKDFVPFLESANKLSSIIVQPPPVPCQMMLSVKTLALLLSVLWFRKHSAVELKFIRCFIYERIKFTLSKKKGEREIFISSRSLTNGYSRERNSNTPFLTSQNAHDGPSFDINECPSS